MSLIYKTLFDVKLMHEFFITDKDGMTKFDEPDQAKRINFLLDAFSLDKDSINTDLQYDFPGSFQKQYDGYHFKLLPTYSGFRVVARVNQKNLADGTMVFEPLVSLPDDLNIYTRLLKRNTSIDNYTNSRINRSVPSIYFFSNQNLSAVKTSPYLAGPISANDTNYNYEQGELASFGANDIREFYKNDGGDPWNPVKGKTFANENDRLLVPLQFNYSFGDATGITQANFSVKDKNGNEVKAVSMNSAEAVTKTTVNFLDNPDLLSLPQNFSFADYIFSLEVTGSNGFSKTHKIIFSDALYEKDCWGIINIRPVSEDPLFGLFANDGFLKKRKSAAGVWTEAPVFEIPIKSRFSYWRYINDKGDALELISDLDNYLFKDNGFLLTKKPLPISRSYFMVPDEAGVDPKYLPNPVNYDLKRDTKNRFCFDIKVPRSELFPVA